MDKLTNAEKDVIKDFINIVDEMRASKLLDIIREKGSLRVTLNYKKGNGMSIDSNLPHNEEITWFLAQFRKILSEKERIHFFKVMNIIFKADFLPEENKKNLIEIRKLYSEYLKSKTPITYKINDTFIIDNVEMLLDIFINGEFFHADEEKIRKIEHLKSVSQYEFLRNVFTTAFIDLSILLFSVRNNLKGIKFDN